MLMFLVLGSLGSGLIWVFVGAVWAQLIGPLGPTCGFGNEVPTTAGFNTIYYEYMSHKL